MTDSVRTLRRRLLLAGAASVVVGALVGAWFSRDSALRHQQEVEREREAAARERGDLLQQELDRLDEELGLETAD